MFFVRLACLRAARDAYVFAAVLACCGSAWLTRHRPF